MGAHKPTYTSWLGLRQRCNNPKAAGYKYYGGKGIKVCRRWARFTNFLADMGERPTGTSIDRLDSNDDYRPGNCRWATAVQQIVVEGSYMDITPEFMEKLDKLIAMTWQPRWKRVLLSMRTQLSLPMEDVLARIPGDFVNDKIKAIGVSRNTYYEWMRESFRPNQVQAAKLAKLTGYPADAIHGQKEDDNDARRSTAKKAAAVARSGKATPRLHGRAPRRRRRVLAAQDRGGGV